jgi:hypothetical protein
MKRYIVATVVALLLTGGVATAAVTVDPATGTGFAGKGDVQAALHLPNPSLQRHARAIQFRLLAVTTADISWECGFFPDPNGGPTQFLDRNERFLGTSAQRLSDSVVYAGPDLTGFNLTGFSGDPITTAHWFGPQPGSPGFGACPAGWQLISPPHASPSTTTFLQVSRHGRHWAHLLTLPQ